MFLICGEALYDMFAGEASPDGGLSLDARPGGSPFNVAIGLARLGSPVAFYGAISQDMLGEQLHERLNTEGVDTRFVMRSDQPTTLSIVGAKPDGTPAYTFYGVNAADRSLPLGDVPALPPSVTGLHVGSYSLVVNPIADTISALVAREAGHRLISLDPNVRPAIEPDMAVWRRRVAEIAVQADVIKASREDLELLWPGKSIDALAGKWLSEAASLVVVTDEDKGVLAHSRKQSVRVMAEPCKVVDTVGAGDAFQAALLHGMARLRLMPANRLADITEADMMRLAAFACRAAAVTCSRRGASLPYVRDFGREL